MAFSEEVVRQALHRADGKCECRRSTHGHSYVRCNKELVCENRGRETGRGAWKAHHVNSNGPDLRVPEIMAISIPEILACLKESQNAAETGIRYWGLGPGEPAAAGCG